MKTAIILHGTLGSPQGNWFQWLKKELESRGLTVWLPELPNASQPSLNAWAKFVQKECPFIINKDTLIVGHSSGAILALVIAQKNMEPIGGIVAVSVFHDNSLKWEPNNELFDVNFEWDTIHANTKKLLFVHSDNDPYVPLEQARFVANNCQAEIVVLPEQGHFNLEKNELYREFPKLVELMELSGLLHLISFTYDGSDRKVSYIETMQVKDGVECDTYSFVGDNSQDLATIRVDRGAATPRQRILKGTSTLEGFVAGEGELTVERTDGAKEVFPAHDSDSKKVVVAVQLGEIMQWHAAVNRSLLFYEICQPPYEDGRFENLPDDSHT